MFFWEGACPPWSALTFMTSTCRSSWSDGVTRTASNIWPSSCFSRTSTSAETPPTNLSSHRSFWTEHRRDKVLTQDACASKKTPKNIKTLHHLHSGERRLSQFGVLGLQRHLQGQQTALPGGTQQEEQEQVTTGDDMSEQI